MATRKKPAPRTAASTRTPPGYKKISLKKIISEIDKALGQLDQPPAKAALTKDPISVERAQLSLRGARDAVMSACVPEFDVPI